MLHYNSNESILLTGTFGCEPFVVNDDELAAVVRCTIGAASVLKHVTLRSLGQHTVLACQTWGGQPNWGIT